jgi:glycosyltransferase involved in cell wall biosynthesis
MHEDSASMLYVGEAVDISDADPQRFCDHGYAAPVKLPFALPTRVYGAMIAVWQFRHILQKRFPLHHGRSEDYVRYLAWCVAWGRRKYRLLRELNEWDAELNRPINLPQIRKDRWAGTLTVGQYLFSIAHFHYTLTAITHHRIEREKGALAYWRGGRLDARLPPPPSWQAKEIEARFGSVASFAGFIATSKERVTHDLPALISRFKLAELNRHHPIMDGTVQPIDYNPCSTRLPLFRAVRVPLPRRAIEAASMAQLGTALLKRAVSESELSEVTATISKQSQAPMPSAKLPFGVNLFGHARGELGIGEDVRLAARALHANGIPFCIVDVEPGHSVSKEDRSVEAWITDEPIYAINLFCMTGFEHNRYVCEQGLDHIAGRYNIGMWPWELPNWPQSCHFTYALVDEIWGISSFTANAFRDAPCPVKAMTLSICIDRIGPADRASFGIPPENFVFLTAFDVNSTFARKNPIATVKAFKLAFPTAGGAKVSLVVKASHVRPREREWRRLKRIVANDNRIIIIPETLRKPEVIGLINAADCFVSLHRSEGFGRSIAEALALGKTVIATGYSGNLDYCNTPRSHLVNYREKKLGTGEYFFGEGQTWAEPDIDHAAELMQKVVKRRGTQVSCTLDLSPETVGAMYAERLREIAFELSGENREINV